METAPINKKHKCPFDQDELFNIGPLEELGDKKDNWACPTCHRLWVGPGVSDEWFTRVRRITQEDAFRMIHPELAN